MLQTFVVIVPSLFLSYTVKASFKVAKSSEVRDSSILFLSASVKAVILSGKFKILEKKRILNFTLFRSIYPEIQYSNKFLTSNFWQVYIVYKHKYITVKLRSRSKSRSCEGRMRVRKVGVRSESG